MKILVLNSGSSSQKTCVYEIADSLPADPPKPIWQAKAEWNGDHAEVTIQASHAANVKEKIRAGSRQQVLKQILDTLLSEKARVISRPSEISAVGHRVVNGGPHYQQPTAVTPKVKASIAKMSMFAPLHNRAELQGMEVVAKLFGRVPQVAVFDTGFHSRLP